MKKLSYFLYISVCTALFVPLASSSFASSTANAPKPANQMSREDVATMVKMRKNGASQAEIDKFIESAKQKNENDKKAEANRAALTQSTDIDIKPRTREETRIVIDAKKKGYEEIEIKRALKEHRKSGG